MTRFDRRHLITSGAAAALLAATGATAARSPKRGGQFRIALSGAARSDNWWSDGLFMQVARGAVFETLTELAPDGTLRGNVAVQWTTKDAVNWLFDLTPDVRFHDGLPLVADDITASLSDPSLNIQTIEMRRDRLRIVLNAPNPSLPYALADPRHALRAAAMNRQGIGTGLYVVDRFRAGQSFAATRIDRHCKDGFEGWFEQIEMTSIPSETVRQEALRDGFVDVADVTALDAYCDPSEFHCLPSRHDTSHVVHQSIALPPHLGQTWPLDNLAMTRRWWKA